MNKSVSVIIIDDEPYSRHELEHLLQEYEEVEIVAEAGSGEEGLEKILLLEPDLVFVDMEMPRMTGMELVEAIQNLKKVPLIVFATAYPDYAIQAFRFQALDYLLKPFSPDELAETMKRVYKALEISKKITTGDKISRLAVEHQEKIIYVSPESILYASAEEGDTVIVTKDNRYQLKTSLKDLERKLLPHYFFRTHKSYLVNLQAVQQLIPWFNGAYQIKLVGIKEEIPVSRNYIKALRKQLEL
ncbi:LytR/AlgR family response regulator transcription factor [Cohnella sp.]|uniref:LytR/AlgR family response regulator transcription factor n=1 Tax=Cohnella sp. TaxID=1883426 RepID=UPI003565BE65